MSNKWNYVTKTTKEQIEKVEKEFNYKFKEEFKEFILKNNAGSPEKYVFDLPSRTEKCFGGLLSFNENDDDNIFSTNKKTIDDEIYPTRTTALYVAGDPFGNLIGFDKTTDKVVFWDHELDTIEVINNDWFSFIDSLYQSKH